MAGQASLARRGWSCRARPGGEVVVDGPQLGDGDPVAFHDRAAAVDRPLGVAGLGGALAGAVHIQRTPALEPPLVGHETSSGLGSGVTSGYRTAPGPAVSGRSATRPPREAGPARPAADGPPGPGPGAPGTGRCARPHPW